MLGRTLRNPIIIGTLVGLVLSAVPWDVPDVVLEPFRLVGAAAAPLALLIGMLLNQQVTFDAAAPRRLGAFWAEVLDWPLVWDENDETAIQSPHGGPKITWGGPPLNPRRGKNRVHFDLRPREGSRERHEAFESRRVRLRPRLTFSAARMRRWKRSSAARCCSTGTCPAPPASPWTWRRAAGRSWSTFASRMPSASAGLVVTA